MMGEKPLYNGWQSRGERRCFLFASEPGALEQHPAFAGQINRRALTGFARHGYVGAGQSIWDGIAKLEPGTLLSLPQSGVEPALKRYWSFSAVVAAARDQPFSGTLEDASERLEGLLGQAVERQMLSNVPLGARLSGGIDSTAIVMLMTARASAPVKTFTIGFEDPAWDESQSARAIARHLGSDHHELQITAADAMAVIPQLSADLVIGYTVKPNIWGSLAARAANVRSASMVTGLGYAFIRRGGLGRGLLQLLIYRLYRLATAGNQVVIFQNPDDRADFIAAGCLADPDKARLVNGSVVDLRQLQPPSPCLSRWSDRHYRARGNEDGFAFRRKVTCTGLQAWPGKGSPPSQGVCVDE